MGLCVLPALETATSALAYTATPESATLELPCAAIVFRDRMRPTVMYLLVSSDILTEYHMRDYLQYGGSK